MRRATTAVMLLLLCAFVYAQPQWISFDKGNNQPQKPEVKVLSSDTKSTVLEVTIPGVFNEMITSPNGTFQSISFLGDSKTNEVGMPEVPYLSEIIAIPNEASISYKVLEASDYEVLTDILLPPARKSWFEGEDIPNYKMDEVAYKSKNIFPGENVDLSEPFIMRDFRLTRVSVFPAQYNTEKNELKIAKKLKVEINYGDGQTKNIKTTPNKKIAPSFAAIYRQTILNYSQVLNDWYNGKEDGEEVLLMIIPDNFYEYFEDYIEWKQTTGFKVMAVKFSDIGATSTNPVTIKNYIADLYATSDNPPTYVANVGDADEFPYKIAVYSDYSFPDEDFFVKVDGDDFIPDMFIGRISVQTTNTLQVILNKLLLYEKEPLIDDSKWFMKGICCSNNLYESQVATKEYTADLMLNEGNFERVDEYMSDAEWQEDCTYTMSDVLAALNEGRSFLNYRGEGWNTGWWANCTPFQIEDLDYLQNTQKLTFVTSIGCGVAMFNANIGNSFGERWLKMGTLENPRGAVNFIGPTSNTHTTYNNYLDKGIYDGMFTEALYTPGQALLRGKLGVLEQFGTEDFNTEYQFRVYCSLGDPSSRIWKETPLNATIVHPVIIDTETSSISVYVGDIDLDKRDIFVNISGASLSMNKRVGDDGIATFQFESVEVGTINVTITGTGLKPYFGTITVEEASGISGVNNTSQLVNVPNPFKHSTDINYTISQSSQAVVSIYDLSGKLIKTLKSQYQPKGSYTITWDGCDQSGNEVSGGVYFLSIQTGKEINTIRLLKMN
jgi:hypothetical protein